MRKPSYIDRFPQTRTQGRWNTNIAFFALMFVTHLTSSCMAPQSQAVVTKIQGGQPASEVEERSVANLLFLDRAPCNDGEAVLYSCGGARLDLGDPEDVGIYASAAHCAAIYRGGRIEKGWLMRDNAAARTLLPTRSSRCRSAHDVVNFLQEIHQAERAEEAVAFDMQSDVFYPRSYQGIHDNFTKDIALLVTDKPFAEHQALALAGDPKGPMLAVIGVGTTDCHYTWEVARSAESGRSVEGLARRSGSSRYSRGAFVVQGAHVPEHFDITQAVGPLLVSRRMDRAVNPIWGLLEDEMIGIDYDFANTVVCKGDSGSPIVTKARRYVGIMSVVLPYYAAPEVSDVARAWSHYLHNGGDPRAAPEPLFSRIEATFRPENARALALGAKVGSPAFCAAFAQALDAGRIGALPPACTEATGDTKAGRR